MNDAEIEALVDPILKAALGGHDLRRTEVLSGEDHDGDAALFVKLHFGDKARLPIGDEANAALVQVRRALMDREEERFPHMDFIFPKDPVTKARLNSQFAVLLPA